MDDFRFFHGGMPERFRAGQRPTRVLIADPQIVISDASAMILNLSGFSAFSAHNAEEALLIARDYPLDVAFIELLICDEGAIDLAVRILAVRPECRIVIWTGRANPVLTWVMRDAEERLGGCDLILKPIHPEQMMKLARGEEIPERHTSESILQESKRDSSPELNDESTYLTGPELEEYLCNARRLMMEITQDQKRKIRDRAA